MTKTRQLAQQILYQVLEEDAYANVVLDKTLNRHADLSSQDKAFIAEVVYGTVRRVRYLDQCLLFFTGNKIAALDAYARTILRMALYQIIYMSQTATHAIVHESVEAAKLDGGKKRKRDKFVNGVLRNFLRKYNIETFENYIDEKPFSEALAIKESLPTWMVELWKQSYGTETCKQLAESMNQIPSLWIRIHQENISVDRYCEMLHKEGILYEEHPHISEAIQILSSCFIRKLPGYKEGYFQVQDISSMHVARAANITGTSRIWDMCAAPGGKSTHIWDLSHGEKHIFATDIHDHRIRLIRENTKRLGISNLQLKVQDATAYKPSEQFDVIILDAPCSGLGVLNRRADSRWKKKSSDIKELMEIQIALLEKAYQALRAGGYLVYSTCTLNPEENEKMLDRFKDKHTNLVWDTTLQERLSWLSFDGERSDYSFFPFQDHTDGFYLACLYKKRSAL